MQAEGGGRASCSFVGATSPAAAGRPGRRWALQIVCSPLPTPMSESEHDSPHFPICCGRRLCRVGSWLMPTGPLAQDGGG